MKLMLSLAFFLFESTSKAKKKEIKIIISFWKGLCCCLQKIKSAWKAF